MNQEARQWFDFAKEDYGVAEHLFQTSVEPNKKYS